VCLTCMASVSELELLFSMSASCLENCCCKEVPMSISSWLSSCSIIGPMFCEADPPASNLIQPFRCWLISTVCLMLMSGTAAERHEFQAFQQQHTFGS
jgi:hypothetical protein